MSSKATDTSAREELLAIADLGSVGILGGTFNPPHLGHVALARRAREELALERVLLMPARIAPHKSEEPDPGAEHRLCMCRLAVEGEPGLSACALEIERAGPSFTVDTLQAIHASNPGAELTFIVGADIARTLPSWRQPAKVLELASLAVAPRSGSSAAEVLETVASLRDCADGAGSAGGSRASEQVSFLQMPVMEISSSRVRRCVALGEPVDQLVGSAVAGYIAEHGLYRASAGLGS